MSRRLIYTITQHCTDRCAKCNVWILAEKESERLPLDRFLACLRYMSKQIDEFIITGGEPMLCESELLAIARASRDCGITMMFNTNAVLLNPRFLTEYGALGHKIAISVDTIDPKKWASFRGNDHYDLVMANIEKAFEIFGDARVFYLFVLAKETADELEPFRKFCEERRRGYLVQPYMDWGGKWHPVDNPPVPPQIKCTAWQNVCISQLGHVRKCFEQYRIEEGEEFLGDLHKETIEEILQKPRTLRITERMKSCNLFCRYLLCNN